jgi:hypothetical protein
MRLSSTSTSVTSKSSATSAGGPAANSCVFSMRYHMFGDDNNSWELYVYVMTSGGSATEIARYTNRQHTSSSDEWDLLTYDLMPSFAGQDVRIFMVHRNPSSGNKFSADTALDALTLTTNGVAVDYSAQNNAAKWQDTSSNGGYSTLSNALNSVGWETLPNQTASNTAWFVEAGGPTPSSSTGPDMAFDNNMDTDYIYFEASGVHTNYYYPLRMTNTFTVPS